MSAPSPPVAVPARDGGSSEPVPAGPASRPLTSDPLTLRAGFSSLLLYALVALAFSIAALAIELALGDPLATGRSPAVTRSLEDAAWHLVTGLAIALPTRRRALILMTPLFALVIDVDHVFGSLSPTVVGREAHDVFFVLLLAVVLGWRSGRAWTQVALGATFVHLGVDGGAFPLLAPVMTQTWGLPFAVALVLILAAAALVGLADRAPRQFLRPTSLFPTAVAVLAILLASSAVSWVQVFSGS